MAQPQQRRAQGVVRFYNFLPERESFLEDVLRGLALPQKSLPQPLPEPGSLQSPVRRIYSCFRHTARSMPCA